MTTMMIAGSLLKLTMKWESSRKREFEQGMHLNEETYSPAVVNSYSKACINDTLVFGQFQTATSSFQGMQLVDFGIQWR